MSQIGDVFSAEFEVLEFELLNEIEVGNRFYQRFGNFELRATEVDFEVGKIFQTPGREHAQEP